VSSRLQVPIAAIKSGGLAVALAIAALVAVGAALASAMAGRQGSSAPTVVVSPLLGTRDANPQSQISFLGVAASRLHDIVVVGSRSGPHSGRLVSYSTHTGGSFLPSRPFDSGESVTVSATVVGYGSPARIGTTFRVSTPYTLPFTAPSAAIPATRANVMRFHSRHDLEPPAVTVTTAAANPSLGDIFLTPDTGPGQEGPEILAPTGQLVWFDPLPLGTRAFDLKAQRYRGAPVLTWWQGQVVEGHGQGVDVIESARYIPIATVRAGNGLYADLHDFEITSQGTAWLTAYAPQHWNLSPYGGPRDGLIDDSVVQEIDIKTGLVMYEWHAIGHVAISDTYKRIPRMPTTVLDFFHLNSIDPLPNGELLISSRNTWATYLISQATGRLVWRLGGKKSSFRLGPGVRFAWQHDALVRADGTISLFDNEAAPAEATQSRVLDIALDDGAHSATLVHQLTYPGQGILSESEGGAQLLSNGDAFISWGQTGEVSELSAGGQLTFDMRLAPPGGTYQAFRVGWSAQPVTQPALAAAGPVHGITQLYASWNGATGVASWRVLAGPSPTSLAVVGIFPSQGFETAIAAPTAAPYVRVQALSAGGALLRSSRVVQS
jgi:Arylsulfotransferase (ASST)